MLHVSCQKAETAEIRGPNRTIGTMGLARSNGREASRRSACPNRAPGPLPIGAEKGRLLPFRRVHSLLIRIRIDFVLVGEGERPGTAIAGSTVSERFQALAQPARRAWARGARARRRTGRQTRADAAVATARGG